MNLSERKNGVAGAPQIVDDNSGLEIFGALPENHDRLQRRFAREVCRSLIEEPITTIVSDDQLLEDQRASLSKDVPVTMLILGACGSLASGFLSRGALELGKSFGGRTPVRYVMCDVYRADSSEVEELLRRRVQQGEYELHNEVPYIALADLNKETLSHLEVDLIIAATPPNVHVTDALRAQELGIKTYIEKPAYPAAFGDEKRPAIERAIKSGQVGLIDFFLGNRALLDFLDKPEKYLSGNLISPGYSLGPIEFMHATCIEPHSVAEEGPRQNMLMSYEAQGGFLYADLAPHPQVILEATINRIFGQSLSDSSIVATYRTRDTGVAGPPDAETGAAVLRRLGRSEEGEFASLHHVDLLGVVGKGIQVLGGAEQTPLINYMLSVGCSFGRVDICVGNGQNTLRSYIAITPDNSSLSTRIFEYSQAGLGYGLILADFVIAAQAARLAKPVPTKTEERLLRHTSASLSAMKSIEEVYRLWNRNPKPIQRYGSGEELAQPRLPVEMPLACFIHGHMREHKSAVGRELLKK